MRLKIYYNGQYVDITGFLVNGFTIDRRIDQTLDSATFEMVVKEADIRGFNFLRDNIPPFSIGCLEKENSTEFWCISSEVKEIGNNVERCYYHTITLVEPTKMLETFDIGSKSFSISDEREINTNAVWISHLLDIAKDLYGVNISMDSRMSQRFNQEREFAFGSGATLFDEIKEIMGSQNCYPRLVINDSEYMLTYFDYDTLIEVTRPTEYWYNESSVTKSQSIDEYCDEIVTEMQSVVDRDTFQVERLTCRSMESVTKDDNACLVTSNDIEEVQRLRVFFDKEMFLVGDVLYIPDEYAQYISWNPNAGELSRVGISWFLGDGGDYNVGAYPRYRNNPSWINMVNMYFGNDPYKRISAMKGYEGMFYFAGDNTTPQKFWIDVQCLEKSQYDLIREEDKPFYAFFTSGSNVIDGISNYYDRDFWLNLIGRQDRGTILQNLISPLGNSNVVSSVADQEKNYKIGASDVISFDHFPPILINEWYIIDTDSYTTQADYSSRKYLWEVKYLASSPVAITQEKLENTNSTKFRTQNIKHSRSYNNGANTIDYNQLVPSMVKNANMLGLQTTQMVINGHSLDIGSWQAYGFVISTSTSYVLRKGEIVIDNSIVDMCKNGEQIVAAIGVQTQYEATNVPSNGIIQRFIKTSHKVLFENELEDLMGESECWMTFRRDGDDYILAKPCTRLNAKYKTKENGFTIIKNKLIIVCKMEDNFSLMSSVNKSVNYASNKANPLYGQTLDSKIYVGLAFPNISPDASDVLSVYNSLPKIEGTNINRINQIFEIPMENIHKDSREQLVFSIEII